MTKRAWSARTASSAWSRATTTEMFRSLAVWAIATMLTRALASVSKTEAAKPIRPRMPEPMSETAERPVRTLAEIPATG